MRHLNKGRSLSRSASHRKALLANLAQELFQRKRISTTLIKAKELRPYAEKLVTNAKKGHLGARRLVLRHLSRASVVKTLFEEIAPAYADRNGGYTRIIKLGPRIGDNAELAIIEMVGFENVAAVETEKKDKKGKQKKGQKAPAAKKSKADAGKGDEEKAEKKPGRQKKAAGSKPSSKSGKASSKASGSKGAAKRSSKSGDRG